MQSFTFDLATAFLAGILGSLHCIGMCGPLASFGCRSGLTQGKFKGPLLFVLGKFLSYSILGLLAGLLGSMIIGVGVFGKMTAILSAVGGIFILWAILWTRFRKAPQGSIFAYFSRAIAKFSFRTGAYASLYLGIAAALLPCGLLYAMVARSAAAGEPLLSMGLMQAFGLGTTPALLGLGALVKYIPQRWNRFGSAAGEIVLVLTGMVLIWRGAIGVFADPVLGPACCQH